MLDLARGEERGLLEGSTPLSIEPFARWMGLTGAAVSLPVSKCLFIWPAGVLSPVHLEGGDRFLVGS